MNNQSEETCPGAQLAVRVKALLAKAESTDSPQEAEALTAKAEALIVKYGLELAETAVDGQDDAVVTHTWEFVGTWAIALRRIVCYVASVLPAAMNLYFPGRRGQRVTIWAHRSEMPGYVSLLDSLIRQAQRDEQLWRAVEHAAGRKPSQSHRRSYFEGWALGVSDRLRSRYEDDATGSAASRELVLVPRRRRLEDYVTRTEGPWRVGLNSRVATNAATGQGWNDGQQANLGAAELLNT